MIFKRFLSVLVLAEHHHDVLSAKTRNTLTAAKQLGGHVSILIAGEKITKTVEELSQANGVKEIIKAENAAFKGFLAEAMAPLVVAVQKKIDAQFVVGSSSALSKAIIPRVASLLDVSPISDVVAIKNENTFVRPIYAGNAMQTFESKDKIKVMTVRNTSFEADPLKDGKVDVVDAPSGDYATTLTEFVSEEVAKKDIDLSTAEIVVSGGRGLGSKENFEMIFELARKLKAGVGASRAAVDAGYVGNELQVGQTGKVIAPRLYIAIGISGAIQHIAGIKDAKTIVAINKDPDAPIFQIADYGIVGDYKKIIPELMSKL